MYGKLTQAELREDDYVRRLANQKFMLIKAKTLISPDEWEKIHRKDHDDEFYLHQELIEAAGLDYKDYWRL